MMKIFILFLLMLLVQVMAQAQQALCIETPDPLSSERLLLKKFREVYPDNNLRKWNWANYHSVRTSILNMDAIKDVKFTIAINRGNEFIDRRIGGVTRANVLKGLEYSRNMALASIPKGFRLLTTPAPIVVLIKKGTGQNGVPCGIAWAWNSLKYSLNGKVYEHVYFYHGSYVYIRKWEDAELFFIADKSVEIKTSCKKMSYQVIR
ncbi:MAG: hypothetical protein HQK83_15505 [Fibrobacteria bacterium]|nr:hypothetical protein [Fibrobacteria bacterium]